MDKGKVVLVTRHSGAVEWYLRKYGKCPVHSTIDQIQHIDDSFLSSLERGDVVVGIMPMHIAAEICRRTLNPIGILSLDRPEHWRSAAELSADEMEELNARVEWFLTMNMTEKVEAVGVAACGL